MYNTYYGEMSTSVLRIMKKGKLCITNNKDWFSEIPDGCISKIELDGNVGNIEAGINWL